jgi:hypothetical protein
LVFVIIGFCLLSRSTGRGLLNVKLTAGGLYDLANRVRLNKLESIAEKGASVANRGTNRHRTGRERNVQLHDLPNRNILFQHSPDPDLADVQSATL